MEPYIGLLSSCATNLFLKKDLVILEIGVNKGHSTRAFLSGLDKRVENSGNGLLYSVDINDCYSRINDKWVFVLGDSKKIEWNRGIDILFIDGDHTYEGVKADYEKYEPFVRSNGIIFLHDILQPESGVRIFFEEIRHPKIKLCLNRQGLGVVTKS